MGEKSTREIFFPELYFRTGGRRIDFVILISTKTILSTEKGRDKFANFLDQLEDMGMDLEYTSHSKDEDLAFIKIHVPHAILEDFADATNIDLVFKTPSLPLVHKLNMSKCLRTALSYNDERSPIYYRAKETIGRKKAKK
ncbi:hypothetical protein HHI36_012880 [Cryptolaemus montrouzieri]|uniref:Anoctamin dimerisation domain-containing protein n=1 Tax=Cryptolaemus montrouzieri TaxID=559131 RepID=A0ABD2NFG5_9CUCU